VVEALLVQRRPSDAEGVYTSPGDSRGEIKNRVKEIFQSLREGMSSNAYRSSAGGIFLVQIILKISHISYPIISYSEYMCID
jgi:hypothetical protein